MSPLHIFKVDVGGPEPFRVGPIGFAVYRGASWLGRAALWLWIEAGCRWAGPLWAHCVDAQKWALGNYWDPW